MFGCDKFCTYCIVPQVRGPEQSRPAAEIVAEVRRLAADGCLEVTLLGQTVNSYKDASDGPARCGWPTCWPGCTRSTGLRRIKFVTNYPAAHDRRPAPGRARPAEGLALSARAGAERLERAY